MQWKFESLAQMGDYFEEQGRKIRARIPNAISEASKRTMRAEAHAYEQCAMIARSAVIESKND